jgi:chromosome segregation ATPase
LLQTSLKRDCSRLQAEVQRLNACVTEKEQALSDALSDCARTAAALKQACQDLQLCRDSKAELQSDMSKAQNELAVAQETAAVATAKYEELKARVDTQHKQLIHNESRLAEEQQVSKEAQGHVAALQHRIEEFWQKAQDAEKRASESCHTALAAREQVVTLQQALQDAEKRAHESSASAAEERKSASAAMSDLAAVRQLHTGLGWLNGDHAGGRVSEEDLTDLKRELQSLQ